MAQLTGRHALVTGGGRGIGRAIAAALTKAGATVTVTGRATPPLREAVLNGEAAAYTIADATDPKAILTAVQNASAARGPIDILVANAGAADSAPFHKTDAAHFWRMMDVNFMSVVHAAHAVIGDMNKRKFGRIVAIASTAGLRGYAYVSAYTAAKHAVVGLVRSLAAETAKTGITVNAVCPGYTDTDMVRSSVSAMMQKTGRSEQDILGELQKEMPIGRLIKPDEVAASVVYLCSAEAAAVTGTTLTIAGGEL